MGYLTWYEGCLAHLFEFIPLSTHNDLRPRLLNGNCSHRNILPILQSFSYYARTVANVARFPVPGGARLPISGNVGHSLPIHQSFSRGVHTEGTHGADGRWRFDCLLVGRSARADGDYRRRRWTAFSCSDRPRSPAEARFDPGDSTRRVSRSHSGVASQLSPDFSVLPSCQS